LRILVTGGGGFLGTAVCRQLATRGHQPIAFQRSAAPHLASEGLEVIRGSVTDLTALQQAAAGCEAVIHTAGKAGVWGKASEYQHINVEGTSHVITACRKLSISYLVHTSSPSVVHSGGDIEGADESLPIASHFTAPYPASKAQAEQKVLAANGTDLLTVALRPHLIWGPGDPHILPRLLSKVRRGQLALPGPRKIVDTIFVENAALAHVMALEELASGSKCAGKPYFVTNNEPLPQGEIIQKLLGALGVDVRIRSVPPALAMFAGTLCEFCWRLFTLKGEPPVTRFAVEQMGTAHWFDASAAEQDFGYLPAFSIAQGLQQLESRGL
jgi:nucleoside-diphosphate-sugar epimerase